MLRPTSPHADEICPKEANSRRAGYAAVFFLSLGTFFVFLLPARAVDPNLAKAIREAASQAPLLEPFTPGEPKYQVFRLNTAVVSHRGQRYSVIRLRIPAGPRQPLVWMFSDLTSIQEYELVRKRDDRPVRGNLRVIYPQLTDPDLEEEEKPPKVSLLLPRPWDLFEFHLLGVPEELLQPDEEYLVWFRFGDARPMDLLLAAVFLKHGTRLSESALPAMLGLPDLPAK